ncbi:hypothetical protein Pelo_13174 [Pelomyxa schiedti]|nr:hypothetical protein Pelo_13174 [Pelomyxa schiedti]
MPKARSVAAGTGTGSGFMLPCSVLTLSNTAIYPRSRSNLLLQHRRIMGVGKCPFTTTIQSNIQSNIQYILPHPLPPIYHQTVTPNPTTSEISSPHQQHHRLCYYLLIWGILPLQHVRYESVWPMV